MREVKGRTEFGCLYIIKRAEGCGWRDGDDSGKRERVGATAGLRRLSKDLKRKRRRYLGC